LALFRRVAVPVLTTARRARVTVSAVAGEQMLLFRADGSNFLMTFPSYSMLSTR